MKSERECPSYTEQILHQKRLFLLGKFLQQLKEKVMVSEQREKTLEGSSTGEDNKNTSLEDKKESLAIKIKELEKLVAKRSSISEELIESLEKLKSSLERTKAEYNENKESLIKWRIGSA
ncbi:uncharacterized protein LOC120346708 isoform X4 [Styela clava]